jgi:hypothetical protein
MSEAQEAIMELPTYSHSCALITRREKININALSFERSKKKHGKNQQFPAPHHASKKEISHHDGVNYHMK